MNIIIPIKQVPETGSVKMDKEPGTMVREGVESIINPLDLYAIEVGLELRERGYPAPGSIHEILPDFWLLKGGYYGKIFI